MQILSPATSIYSKENPSNLTNFEPKINVRQLNGIRYSLFVTKDMLYHDHNVIFIWLEEYLFSE